MHKQIVEQTLATKQIKGPTPIRRMSRRPERKQKTPLMKTFFLQLDFEEPSDPEEIQEPK